MSDGLKPAPIEDSRRGVWSVSTFAIAGSASYPRRSDQVWRRFEQGKGAKVRDSLVAVREELEGGGGIGSLSLSCFRERLS
mmetsp:Transcript_35599/g.56952  ORF Transcript_35599/g.56952 Transcript_35599/m.56952 type:complete len:81 (-) Transcript_35599:412-654(-)|eukprot:CAMPEP_0203762040 /NCGR_PEP_ID=MMETSP0098-20131031/15008_1 /ASSEMBLY_ACC=CAM_ASM_000208 /TAXON_ID=96639 /ORGANISM=" , Strain NY0313808BC1" /LENGTH=80 /DNA_ID=CAMNT_0050656283 /DNA_START=149 /DNA_END=391 /DNA_ORIENTATION=+